MPKLKFRHEILSDEQWQDRKVDLFPQHRPAQSISEYVQNRRVMTDISARPGPWDNSFTPYLVEIMDSMGPYSPYQHGVLMCSAQIGKTSAGENICCYYMDEEPSAILFATATEDLARRWSIDRLEDAIDSLGFRYKMGSPAINRKSRVSGDTLYEKMFVGGNLHIVSAQSAPKLRSSSKRILLRDEIDGTKSDTNTGEGNWLAISEARTKAFRNRRRIFDSSTPGIISESEINRMYELGDCRKYNVPCPHAECGKDQVFEFSGSVVMPDGSERHFGLVPIIKDDQLIDAVYVCRHCFMPITEDKKKQMLERGHWVSTKKSSDPFLISWHLNALYSPFEQWREIYRRYTLSQGSQELEQAFYNLDLGLPYTPHGERPDIKVVKMNRGDYLKRTIPEGVIYLTAAVDVQTGSKNDPTRPPRLELEIMGTGDGYRTWSIDYQVFVGPVDDPHSGAWEDLNDWVAKGNFPFPEIGKEMFDPSTGLAIPGSFDPMSVQVVLIDSGTLTDIVYAFCGRWASTFPCKGMPTVVALADDRQRGNIAKSAFIRYQKSKVGGSDRELVGVNTQFYKSKLYHNLNTVRKTAANLSPAGHCAFPRDYPDSYFEQLVAEEALADGSFESYGRRNEALDCRVYNMCAADMYIYELLIQAQKAAISSGSPREMAERIDIPDILRHLKSQLRRRT